jgi:hypothetical protein
MATPATPARALLFAGLLLHISVDRDRIYSILVGEFGRIAMTSSSFLFTETDYYTSEMGSDLTRVWLGFRKLIEQDDLVDLKLRTNRLEEGFAVDGKRRVNLDPGYLTPGKVVLASTKDNQHRLYLGRGIYAEVTLRYQGGSYRPWEWTYRDYRREEAVRFFNDLRGQYRSITAQEQGA